MVTNFLALAALVLGWLVARRVLRERDPFLAGALAPLLGCSAVLVAANAGLRGMHLAAAISIPAFLLAFVPRTRYRTTESTGVQKVLVVLATLAVVMYTHYAQMRFLDTDNWIHEPLISSYRVGLWPPHNPFFPELTLNGHYGRDLLVSVFTPPGQDPLGTVWFLNPFLQAAAFVLLFTSIRALTGSFQAGFLAAVLMLFGANVGFRVGLADTFDGNNGVVYALLALNLHLLFRLFRPADAGPEGQLPTWTSQLPAWLVTGTVLGIYQVVYETHFGLLLLTGATLGLVFRQRRAWAGLLVVAAVALPMAATEGGPVTDLAHSHGRARQARAVQNQGQHVSVRFPKDKLFTVLATDSIYQRTSAAYRTNLFKGLYRPPQGSGSMSIFAPRFLTTHWLPVYLAPFTLWILWRRRSLPGLALFFFGAWSYLVPGLVDFGPIYEWEYFRWEFASGVALAGALGLALAGWLPPEGGWPLRARREPEGWTVRFLPGALPVTLALLILVADLAAAQKMLNDAVIDVQKKRLPLVSSTRHWRTRQPELRTSEADLDAAGWLAERVQPGQRFLSNRSDDTPSGIWADAVFATLSGALPAGHAFPPGSEGTHAAPPSYADALSRAFWATGRTELLASGGVDWLLADLDQAGPERARQLQADPGLRPGPVFQDAAGQRRQVFQVLPRRVPATSGELSLQVELPPARELRVGKHYAVPVRFHNLRDKPARVRGVQAMILDDQDKPTQETPLVADFDLEVPPGATVTATHSLVTPLDEGEFQYALNTAQVVLRVPFRVDFLSRLAALKTRLDLPDGFRPRQFYRVRLGLTSTEPLQTGDQVELSYRLRRPGGEYVWELDSIPQPLSLGLQPGVEQETFFQMLTPEPGAYDLELVLKDRQTGRTVPLGQPARVAVGEP